LTAQPWQVRAVNSGAVFAGGLMYNFCIRINAAEEPPEKEGL
jgi:hypothetical protein